MKQLLLVLTLLFTVSITAPACAEETRAEAETNEHYSRFFVVPDILIYRPVGFAFTVAGSVLFVAMSPLTAFANIAPPHDAFEKTKDILIMAPASYTFLRPVGNNSETDY